MPKVVSVKFNFHILERLNKGRLLQIIALNLMNQLLKKLGKNFGRTLCSSYFIGVFRFSLKKENNQITVSHSWFTPCVVCVKAPCRTMGQDT